ncbi:hypothetical protein EYF80_002417 [Liparis tanakae]|uniref:Uncharacterized protein n=1 Tax=Liparis tanakae TaxID=230148 RepID=A0A4Z2JA38_9TELE|nr:hypothetical protein EYF80_002417 [Liparis tanakae]
MMMAKRRPARIQAADWHYVTSPVVHGANNKNKGPKTAKYQREKLTCSFAFLRRHTERERAVRADSAGDRKHVVTPPDSPRQCGQHWPLRKTGTLQLAAGQR